VFMGIMLQRSRIAEDLLVTMAQLFGPVRGGLGISVVFVGALLAATTGIVGATVVAMGLISLPAMLRNNYSHSLATGTIAASGTLGQIIPPSIVLIILADQLGSASDQASSARKLLYKATTGELQMPSTFDVTSTSAGEMFLGALIPGLLLVVVYIAYIFIIAALRPKAAPTVPYDGKYNARFAGRVVMSLVPPLALIFIVLGSIIMGIATVNQAGAIGAAGALVMAGYQLHAGQSVQKYAPALIALVSVVVIIACTQLHPLNIKTLATGADYAWLAISAISVITLVIALVWSGLRALHTDDTLRGVMVETAKTSSLVFIILMGAAMLTSVFRGFGGEELVKHFLTGLPGGFWGQFFVVMAVIFILGFFLDFIEIAVVVVPIVAPILLADPGANITAVWLGVMIGVNMQTSFLTPPFGFALFYLRGVAPTIVKTLSIYRGVVPFIMMQLLVLVIVAMVPQMVNYIPQRVSLSAATAPPPVNPGLQFCIEEYMADRFASDGETLRGVVDTARGLDLASLPEAMRGELTAAIDKAGKAFGLLEDVVKAADAIDVRARTYAPLHHEVRDIQVAMRRNTDNVAKLKDDISLIQPDAPDADSRNAVLAAEITALESQNQWLATTIPGDWEERHAAFRKLLDEDRKARLIYRRNVDTAYEPVVTTIRTIDDAGRLAALKAEIEGLRAIIERQPEDKAADAIEPVLTKIGAVAGASALRSAFYQAKRALTGRSPDKNAALQALDKAMPAYAAELAWRQQAAKVVLPGLRTYEEAIRTTIGLRKLEKLPQSIVPTIANCMSNPRDVSLFF
jgi:TRAP-type mannitol/chloroaromatic compound transport system permease large subunit